MVYAFTHEADYNRLRPPLGAAPREVIEAWYQDTLHAGPEQLPASRYEQSTSIYDSIFAQ